MNQISLFQKAKACDVCLEQCRNRSAKQQSQHTLLMILNGIMERRPSSCSQAVYVEFMRLRSIFEMLILKYSEHSLLTSDGQVCRPNTFIFSFLIFNYVLQYQIQPKYFINIALFKLHYRRYRWFFLKLPPWNLTVRYSIAGLCYQLWVPARKLKFMKQLQEKRCKMLSYNHRMVKQFTHKNRWPKCKKSNLFIPITSQGQERQNQSLSYCATDHSNPYSLHKMEK